VGDRRDNEGGDPRTVSGLDATAGVQALVDVQRRGLVAAGDLVDRLVRMVDGDGDDRLGDGVGVGVGDRTGAGASAGARPGARGADAAAERGDPLTAGATDDLVRAWADIVRLGLDAFGQFLPPAATGRPDTPGRATVDIATGVSTGVVRLEVARRRPASGAGPADGTGAGPGVEVWLHNAGGQEHAGLRLHCGDLRASDGAVLPAGALRFDPDVVDLPSRSSRGVVVSVGADPPPGTYRGVILAAGVPDAWLPLEVIVSVDANEV
jgi:hypothetical protein